MSQWWFLDKSIDAKNLFSFRVRIYLTEVICSLKSKEEKSDGAIDFIIIRFYNFS